MQTKQNKTHAHHKCAHVSIIVGIPCLVNYYHISAINVSLISIFCHFGLTVMTLSKKNMVFKHS